MKFYKLPLILLLLFVSNYIFSQIVSDTANINSQELPSYETMKKMGLTDDMIKKIYDYKNKNQSNFNRKQQTPLLIDKDTANKIEPLIKKDTFDYFIPPKDTTSEEKVLKGKIFGQDLLRNKNIKIFERATQTSAPDNYLLGIGDVVSISIWGFAEYNDALRISEEGYINPKYVGRVYLKGLKFKDAKNLLIKKFGQYTDLNNSRIDITLNYSKVININIVGEVMNPGTYGMPALNTVFNALIAANGPTQIGSVRNIYLKRNNKIIDSLDIYKFLVEPDSKNDIYLENNDYIIVPVVKKYASISGEINRPHLYELKPNETINCLIKYAGGLTPSAYTKNIQIKRYVDSKIEILNINLDSLNLAKTAFYINNGDQIFINHVSDEITNIVTVIGSVKIPGSYQLKNGDRVEDIIKKAQGLTYDAFTGMAYIIRNKDDFNKKYISVDISDILKNKNSADNIYLESLDTLKVLSKYAFTDKLKVTVLGAIRKPGDYDFGENFALKDLLIMSGGLKQEASNNRIEISRIIDYNETDNKIIPIRAIVNTVQITNDLSISNEAKNYILQPYDHVYIRSNPDFELPKKVNIQGEVMYPGIYSLTKKDESISELIARAGGFTQFAFIDGVKMNRKFDETGLVYLNLSKALKRPESKFNIILKDSDQIFIPKVVDLVQISGAVGNANFKNINAPYFPNRRSAKFYIKNFAGGFSPDCKKSAIYVIHSSGIIKSTKNFGVFRLYPKVKTGSIVKLPFKEVKIEDQTVKKPIDWNKTIENTTIKITGILTLWLLITKL